MQQGAWHDAHRELEEAAMPLRVRPVSEEGSANAEALDCAGGRPISEEESAAPVLPRTFSSVPARTWRYA